MRHFKLLATAVATVTFLTACGGGGSSASSTPTEAPFAAHGRVASFTPTVSGDVVLTLASDSTQKPIATGTISSLGYFSTTNFDASELVIVTVKNGTHADGSKNFGNYKTVFDPQRGRRFDGSLKIGPFTSVMAELAILNPTAKIDDIEAKVKFFFGVPASADFSIQATSNAALFNDLGLMAASINQGGGFEQVTKDLAKYISDNPQATISNPSTLVASTTSGNSTLVKKLAVSRFEKPNDFTGADAGMFVGRSMAGGIISSITASTFNYGLSQLGFNFPPKSPDLTPEILNRVKVIQDQIVKLDEKLNGISSSIKDIKLLINIDIYNNKVKDVSASGLETKIRDLSQKLSILMSGGSEYTKNTTNLNDLYNGICRLRADDGFRHLYETIVGTESQSGSLIGLISQLHAANGRFLTSDVSDAQLPLYQYWLGLLDSTYVLLDAYYRYGFPQGDHESCDLSSTQDSSRGSIPDADIILKELANKYLDYSNKINKMLPKRIPTGIVLDTKQNLLIWHSFDDPLTIGANNINPSEYHFRDYRISGVRSLGCTDADNFFSPNFEMTFPIHLSISGNLQKCSTLKASKPNTNAYGEQINWSNGDDPGVENYIKYSYGPATNDIWGRGANVFEKNISSDSSIGKWRVPTSNEISSIFYDTTGNSIDLTTEGLSAASAEYNKFTRPYNIVISSDGIFNVLKDTNYYSPLRNQEISIKYPKTSTNIDLTMCKNRVLWGNATKYYGDNRNLISYAHGATYSFSNNTSSLECSNNYADELRYGPLSSERIYSGNSPATKYNQLVQVFYVRPLLDVEKPLSAASTNPSSSALKDTPNFFYYTP